MNNKVSERILIVRSTPYRDTSYIFQALSENYGLISLIAKGYKSSRSKLRGNLVLAGMSYVRYVYKEGTDSIRVISDAELIVYPDFEDVNIVSIFFDIIRSTVRSALHQSLFDNFQSLAQNRYRNIELFRFVIKLLISEGYIEKLHSCISCGKELDSKKENGFDTDLFGALCESCTLERNLLPVNKSVNSVSWWRCLLAKIGLILQR